MVRRAKRPTESLIRIGKLILNPDNKTVEVDGRAVHLTRLEYGTLELLALRKDSTVTKQAILSRLYGGMSEPKPKILDVFVCKLRQKLGSANYIGTVWGRGYVLRDPSPARSA